MSSSLRTFSLPLLGTLGLAAALALPGCGSEDNTWKQQQAPVATIKVNTPTDIAVGSADNYDDNEYGLVTASTLKRWKDNWLAERPAGITGNLVILQVTQGAAGAEYIKPDNVNVFTYLETNWLQDRSNGVIKTPSIVPDGPTTDILLRRYGIDPRKDLIVCAQGTSNLSNAMTQGRCWYTLSYWGVDKKHIAVLNGGNKWLRDGSGHFTAADFTTAQSPIKNQLVASVRDILVDGTALHATLEDVINILPLTDRNRLDDGVLLWDARVKEQFSAGEILEATDAAPTDPAFDYTSTFQNGGSRQGHPRGALQLNFAHLLENNGVDGLYKSKAALANYFAGGTDANGKGFIDGTYQPVGANQAWQPGDVVYIYCETAMRAAIAAVASAVILGKPTRIYDGSMVEWNSLTNTTDKNGTLILPATSPWRTDVLSFYRPNQQAKISPRTDPATTPYIENPLAEHADKTIRADQAYKLAALPTTGTGTGSGSGSGSGGGVVLPPNPCGG